MLTTFHKSVVLCHLYLLPGQCLCAKCWLAKLLVQDDYEMLTRMFSITCWPEAYTDTQAYQEGVFQFIEMVNKWHATKRNQTGPIIVIDK